MKQRKADSQVQNQGALWLADTDTRPDRGDLPMAVHRVIVFH